MRSAPALLLVLLCMVSPAFAGWTVVNLNTVDQAPGSSNAYGVSGAQQVGRAWVASDRYNAALWNGSANGWVNLNPAGSTLSEARGVSGGWQVGFAKFGEYDHAGMWNGTADSWVDLNPEGAESSAAYAISNGRQIGEASFAGMLRVGMWSGTAESWVDLTPAGVTRAHIRDISGNQQVGYAGSEWVPHAGIWSGTAESWADIHPAEAFWSIAAGVSGGRQAGVVNLGTQSRWIQHASLWSGTAESWVDLNPVGGTLSWANDISGDYQVGLASVEDRMRASLWSGTAESWVDLHALLPSGQYAISEASSVETRDGEIWVVGSAQNVSMGYDEAVLWHFTPDPVPEPSSFLVLLGGLGSLLAARSTKRSVCGR